LHKTQAEFIPGMAHNMMLEASWQDVADRILAWLNEQGL
jgi:alpha-beta hydrolase superfamily lysophospholipase